MRITHRSTSACPGGNMDVPGGAGHSTGASRRWTIGKARGFSTSQHSIPTPPPATTSTSTTTTTTTTTTTLAPRTPLLGHRHASTIRAVNSIDDFDYNFPAQDSPEPSTPSFNSAFSLPSAATTTTTTAERPHALSSPPSSSGSASHSRAQFSREHEWDRQGQIGQPKRTDPQIPPNGRHIPAGMLAHSENRSASNGQGGTLENGTRVRTRVIDERSRRDRSPTAVSLRSKNRAGSIHNPDSTTPHAVEYLASVPANTGLPAVPTMSSFSTPSQVVTQPETASGRSTSPLSPQPFFDASTQPSASHRRVKHLMRTLNGGTSGSVLIRPTSNSMWTQTYCYTDEVTGALMCESHSSEGPHRTLIPDLRGCTVRPRVDGDIPYLEVSSSRRESQVQLKLMTQVDFDAWYATLMFWASGGQPPPPPGPATSSNAHGNVSNRPPPPAVARRQSSAHVQTLQGQRERAMSSKSERRKSMVSSHKESPVIKIGKMIFWDTSTHTNSVPPLASSGTAVNARPAIHRLQSFGSRRWRRISGQLRENGELKLHSDADNSLISVVELSQLSRCALQRLDSSVLDCDFCIGIYPQYMAVGTQTQPGFVRPIFLSLENRVYYEVWFVLLRAFTVPQLYGPSYSASEDDTDEQEDVAALPAAATHNMFRVERSLAVRIVEAKLYPPTSPVSPEAGFIGGHSRPVTGSAKELQGYYAEVLLDNETRGKTVVKHDVSNLAWGESFEFLDLPSTLQSAGVVIKRRPPDINQPVEHKVGHDTFTMNGDPHGGYTGINADVSCGRVDISELEEEKEVEKWWQLTNALGERVGDILIKVRAEERVILMARDYQSLSDLLHRFSSNLTLHIAHVIHSDLKRLSDCLLSIFQVSGNVSDWIISLVEDEVDGLHKDTPVSRVRQNKRLGSEASVDHSGKGGPLLNREALVRDLNKNATLEANLLFRGNTLLTKSLDTHMRRVGKEYLEECLTASLQEINSKDLDCEVDPNRVPASNDRERNWRRLSSATAEVWKSILENRKRCPIELRIIFKHIRACAEDTYGDFSRNVSYSSVSGFLFLRFFCPAVLNPGLFGLLKDEVKPRARRTLTLIAKSLQTLANMASFGTKEHWMEPMNNFLNTNRESFKLFIDDVCFVPATISGSTQKSSTSASPAYAPGYFSSETNLSYTTPMTIMQRLPPTSREGFPSLPYLIDQARAFADLVQLWLEAINPKASALDNPITVHSNVNKKLDVFQMIQSEPVMLAFHEACETLSLKTLESLNRAERADPRRSRSDIGTLDPIALIDSLHDSADADGHLSDDTQTRQSLDVFANNIVNEPAILPPGMAQSRGAGAQQFPNQREWDHMTDDEGPDGRPYNYIPRGSISAAASTYDLHPHFRDRPGSAGIVGSVSSIQDSFRRVLASRGSDHSPMSGWAGGSTVSSTVSSDTEHPTTALPSYEREIRHRERRAAARELITQHVEQARVKAAEKKERKDSKPKTPLAALRKKKKEKEAASSAGKRDEPQQE